MNYNIELEQIRTYIDGKISEFERKYKSSDKNYDEDKYIIAQLDKWVEFKQMFEDVKEAAATEFRKLNKKVKYTYICEVLDK